MKSFAKKSLVYHQQRGFGVSVTIKMPKFELHLLKESQMPTQSTAKKEELI